MTPAEKFAWMWTEEFEHARRQVNNGAWSPRRASRYLRNKISRRLFPRPNFMFGKDVAAALGADTD